MKVQGLNARPEPRGGVAAAGDGRGAPCTGSTRARGAQATHSVTDTSLRDHMASGPVAQQLHQVADVAVIVTALP